MQYLKFITHNIGVTQADSLSKWYELKLAPHEIMEKIKKTTYIFDGIEYNFSECINHKY